MPEVDSPSMKEPVGRQRRNKKKQMIYRRHRKQHSPRNSQSLSGTGDEGPQSQPSQEKEPPVSESKGDSPIVTPPRRSRMAKLNGAKETAKRSRVTTSRSPDKVEPVLNSPARPFDEGSTVSTPVSSPARPFDENNTTVSSSSESPGRVPRRLRAASSPVDRKKRSDLIKQIARKKASVMAASPPRQEAVNVVTEEPSEEIQEQASKQVSLQTTDATTSKVEGIAKIDENEPIDDEELQRQRLEAYVQATKDQDISFHQDPPLHEIQSEVSVATSGFDMRSIHDYPLDPPTPESEKESTPTDPALDSPKAVIDDQATYGVTDEANDKNMAQNADDFVVAKFPTDPPWDTSKVVFSDQAVPQAKNESDGNLKTQNSDTLDIFETDSWVKTNGSFQAVSNGNADIDDFAKQLMADQEREEQGQEQGPETVQEEKKEKEVPETIAEESVDRTWDTSNTVFAVTSSAENNHQTGSMDMFDTSSWGQVDAAFSDVSLSRLAQHSDIETQFLNLMKEDLENRSTPLTEEQRQVLEQARSDLEAGTEEQNGAPSCGDTSVPALESKGQLTDSKDEEPLLIENDSGSEANEHCQEPSTSLNERLEGYKEANVADDESSEEVDSCTSDSDSFDDEVEEEVAYVDQGSESEQDDDLEVDVVRSMEVDTAITDIVVEEVPTFDISANAAKSNPVHEATKVDLVLNESSEEVDEYNDDDFQNEEVKEKVTAADHDSDCKQDENLERGVQSSMKVETSTTGVEAQEVSTSEIKAKVAESTPHEVEDENLRLVDETTAKSSPSRVIGSDVAGDSVDESVASSVIGDTFLGTDSVAGSLGGSEATPGLNAFETPPCPENNASSPDERKSKGGGNKIPLIAPPPEEKLKKWEESKTRGQKHLAEAKAKPADEPDLGDPPKVMRKLDIGVEPRIFSSPSKSKLKSLSDDARSPTNVDSVLSDQKMAERVALASSAAAVTFEERLVQGGSVTKPTVSADRQEAQTSSTSPMACFPPDGAEETIVKNLFLGQTMEESPQELGDGAFSSWGLHTNGEKASEEISKKDSTEPAVSPVELETSVALAVESLDSRDLLDWLRNEVLEEEAPATEEEENETETVRITCLLLEDDKNFNKLCEYMAEKVDKVSTELEMRKSFEDFAIKPSETTLQLAESFSFEGSNFERKRPCLKPLLLSAGSQVLSPNYAAASFVSFLFLASKLSKVESPFGNENPFLASIVDSSLQKNGPDSDGKKLGTTGPQQIIFDHPNGRAAKILDFVYRVCKVSENQLNRYLVGDCQNEGTGSPERQLNTLPTSRIVPGTPNITNGSRKCKRDVVPACHPCPFETAIWSAPRILAAALSFLGDPVAVCRMKMANRFCNRIITENEHAFMQDAVRVGGLSMNARPAFWIWIALDKSRRPDAPEFHEADGMSPSERLRDLAGKGEQGKWHHVIQRDVERSFGNMPPHKTGAKLRSDSIVYSLVTWGKNRIMSRGVKGGGEPTPTPELGPKEGRKNRGKTSTNSVSSPPWQCGGDDTASVDSEVSQTPTDTVSDWGGVTPVGSFCGSVSGQNDTDVRQGGILPTEELALSGNSLTVDMKTDLQNKLSLILHSLAACHEDVGYCQGMDYIVAHLLRILQDTIKWKAVQGTLSEVVATSSAICESDAPITALRHIAKHLVVEEAVFHITDSLFTTYNLRHMYWPELRCLKTCCRVFERLIQIKLPVLADHFDHHDLNVGLFALGWFQTLFLYLPSMPSATVCHMWDIWLVERSFKIFFRVGTAILFLSQPILLNHELEGMMTYLNTIPDATLLKPDILIACALNIKVTNRMLQELEEEVTKEY